MRCNRQSRIGAVLLAAIVAAGVTLHCHADAILSEDVGNLTWKYTVTNGAARVYGGHLKTAIGWTAGDVVIPDMLGGLTVKAIGSYAFFELGKMTSLEIPESVETIEFYACRGCSNLVTATLPSNLTTLGDAVFFNCQKLDVGRIPDSVTSMGRDTFWGCKSMRSVKFSAKVRDLDTMTCYNCDSLTEVRLQQLPVTRIRRPPVWIHRLRQRLSQLPVAHDGKDSPGHPLRQSRVVRRVSDPHGHSRRGRQCSVQVHRRRTLRCHRHGACRVACRAPASRGSSDGRAHRRPCLRLDVRQVGDIDPGGCGSFRTRLCRPASRRAGSSRGPR